MGFSWKSIFGGFLGLGMGTTGNTYINRSVSANANKVTDKELVKTLTATIAKLKDKKEKLVKSRKETADAIAKYKACEVKCAAGNYGGTCNGVGMTCAGISINKGVLETELARINGEITKVQKQLDDANAKLAAAKKRLGITPPIVTPPGNNSSASDQVLTSNWSGKWKYNAPMIKHAYFRQSLQSNLLDGMYVDQGNYSDALDAWRYGMGGRGTIQQDRKWIRNVLAQKGQSAKIIKNVSNPWGFKFLYNPTAVSMAWGLQSVADPLFLANTTQLAIQPVTMNLSSAVVDFTLILNRLEDHVYLNSDGSIAGYTKTPRTNWNGDSGTSISEGDVMEVKQDIARWKREQLQWDKDQNPYPVFVPIEDRQMIYERGTMYDIEYLFRTLMSPLEPFDGALNGKTSDRAYLQPAIVELHLGDAMRYRVRVEKFSVNHLVFSPKMVPLFSKIDLSVSRFVDSPETNQNSSNDFKPVSGVKNLNGTAVNP